MKISLPLMIYLPRKTKADKTFWLNLNVYRNSHEMVLSQAKKLYKEQVWASVMEAGYRAQTFNLTPPFKMIYTFYAPTKRRTDISNVLSIVQKFTDDALVDMGFLDDDDYNIVRETVYRFGLVDPDNPRAELEIVEYTGETSTDRQGRFDFAD